MRILERISTNNSSFSISRPVTVAFLGDSVTHGCFETFVTHKGDLDNNYDFDAVYHARLKKKLQSIFHAVRLNIINAGVSGGSSVQGYERLERDILSFSPDLTVVCFGLNDANQGETGLSQYTEALELTFAELLKHDSEVIFMTPNMMNTYVSTSVKEKTLINCAEQTAIVQNSGIMDLYMDAAKMVCLKRNITVCDCYSKWKKLYAAGADVTSLLANGINHPSREMHQMFATSLLDTILFN